MSQLERVKVFFSYSREDEALRDRLSLHLQPLVQQGIITEWRNRSFQAVSEWDSAIDQHISNVDIILLLISPDYLASDYVFDIEMQGALKDMRLEKL